MAMCRYDYGDGRILGTLVGCEAANARKDAQDDPPFTESCVRINWSKDCAGLDWDLWVRERTEPGTGPGDSTKWASYVDHGPVGESGMEMATNTPKTGEESTSTGGEDNGCGVSAGVNGLGSEIVCFCLSDNMTYPKTYDVVINLFGADSGCPDPLGQLCIEYTCCDDDSTGVVHSESVTGMFDFQGLGTAGDNGVSPIRAPTIIFNSKACADRLNGVTSRCWVLRGTRSNGRTFVNRGGGRAPSRLLIPDDVDPASCVLMEDGAKVSRAQYELLHDSVAARMGVERSVVAKGTRVRAGAGSRPCRNCRKRKKRDLF